MQLMRSTLYLDRGIEIRVFYVDDVMSNCSNDIFGTVLSCPGVALIIRLLRYPSDVLYRYTSRVIESESTRKV